MNYVVETLSRGDDGKRDTLRSEVIGTNLDRLFDRGLADAFRLAAGTASYVILDEDNPSTEFPTFGAWITSLTAIVNEIVSAARVRSDWRSERHFFDLRSETVQEIKAKLDEILGGPKAVRQEWFPIP
jgi:hypothetical protein